MVAFQRISKIFQSNYSKQSNKASFYATLKKKARGLMVEDWVKRLNETRKVFLMGITMQMKYWCVCEICETAPNNHGCDLHDRTAKINSQAPSFRTILRKADSRSTCFTSLMDSSQKAEKTDTYRGRARQKSGPLVA